MAEIAFCVAGIVLCVAGIAFCLAIILLWVADMALGVWSKVDGSNIRGIFGPSAGTWVLICSGWLCFARALVC